MFGPSLPILHNGRWTLYAQRLGAGFRVTLVGEATRNEPAVIEEHSGDGAEAFSGFRTQHPFDLASIKAELQSLPGPRSAQESEVTQ